LTKEELKQGILECFEEAPESEIADLLGILQEAQFYTRELERRSDSRVSIRDLVLEIVVILLIGWEIYMGHHQEWQQNRAFQQEQVIWKNMETSSDATAKTLTSLASTTAAMNLALQKQLALFYEVSVTPVWDASAKKITIMNSGRTNVSVWGTRLDDDPPLMWDSRVISPMSTYIVAAEYIFDELRQKVPKGTGRFVSYDLYITNDKGEEFVEHCEIGVSWKDDDLNLAMQIVSVTPEHWRNSGQKNLSVR